MKASRWGVALLLGFCVLVTSSVVNAAEAQNPEQLKARADEAFDGRRYADALRYYQDAIALNRDARLHYNIAQALAALERYPEALVAYQAFIAEAPAGTLNEAQQAQLFALVEDLKAKIARIEINCSVPGVRVLVRGKTVGTTPIASPIVVSAGKAKVEAIAKGYEPYATSLDLAGASTRRINVVLKRTDFTGTIAVRANVAGAIVSVDGVPAGSAPARVRVKQGAHVVEVRAPGHETERRTVTVEATKAVELTATLEQTPDRTLAYVGFGIGGVGIAAGTVTGILALVRFDKAKEQCDQTTKECGPAAQDDLQASKSWGVLSTAAFGVGVVGIGVGTYGLLTAGQQRRTPKGLEVTVSPARMAVTGHF